MVCIVVKVECSNAPCERCDLAAMVCVLCRHSTRTCSKSKTERDNRSLHTHTHTSGLKLNVLKAYVHSVACSVLRTEPTLLCCTYLSCLAASEMARGHRLSRGRAPSCSESLLYFSAPACRPRLSFSDDPNSQSRVRNAYHRKKYLGSFLSSETKTPAAIYFPLTAPLL